MRQWVAALASSCLLGGCATADLIDGKYRNYVNNVPDMDAADVAQFTADNNAILNDFADLAGLTAPPGPNGEWRPVVDAGINYVDTRCDRFMDSLFWLNRTRETTSRQIQYTGAAASAALAIVEATKNAIGLTPLGFALFDQTVNNISAGLLYNLNPSTVRVLVEKRQTAYLQSLTPSYTSKAVALRVIQGYAAICLPPAIEAEVERAIDAKEYAPQRLRDEAPPAANDQTPTAFSFAPVTGVAKGAEVTSNPIVVSGIGTASPISITGGQYQILGPNGKWVSTQGTVAAGDTVQVKVTAPNADNAEQKATLTIGGLGADFTVRTKSAGDAIIESVVPPAPPGPADVPQPVESNEQQNGIPNPQ